MSIVFVPKRLRGSVPVDQGTIQRLLEENDQLIRCITEYQQKGRAVECVQYQQILHRNLVYLATIADASPDIPAESEQVGSLVLYSELPWLAKCWSSSVVGQQGAPGQLLKTRSYS
ncbi:SS18-like protein 2 [Merluccius polli]|uniref:SS18-like protein 2 n=1 Tax=Merluccius polli TaxID=89951 RepID=A0AA47MP13_MERPO|nr:SS18-like protein 2 [Merluccius polli]